MGLFDCTGDRSERAEKVAEAKRAINARHGRFLLRGDPEAFA